MFGITRPSQTPPTSVPLIDIYDQMLDMLEWIGPQLSLTLSFADRFADVHANERSRIESRIKTHFNIP